MDQTIPIPDGNEEPVGPAHRPLIIAGPKTRQAQQLVPLGTEESGQEPPPPLRLRHTAVLVLPDTLLRQPPAQQILTVLVQERQVLQHRRVGGVALLQREGPALCVLRRGLPGEGVDIAALLQCLVRLLVVYTVYPGIERYAVAPRAAEIAPVLVGVSVQAQVVFPRSAVAAEGAAGLDLRTPERPGVDDQPAPPGCVQDRDPVVDHTALPRQAAAFRSAVGIGRTGRTWRGVLMTYLEKMICPAGRTFSRSSTDSMLSTNTG